MEEDVDTQLQNPALLFGTFPFLLHLGCHHQHKKHHRYTKPVNLYIFSVQSSFPLFEKGSVNGKRTHTMRRVLMCVLVLVLALIRKRSGLWCWLWVFSFTQLFGLPFFFSISRNLQPYQLLRLWKYLTFAMLRVYVETHVVF